MSILGNLTTEISSLRAESDIGDIQVKGEKLRETGIRSKLVPIHCADGFGYSLVSRRYSPLATAAEIPSPDS